MAHRRHHEQQMEPLCCVGSKCSALPPASSELFTDAAWNTLLQATSKATLIVKEVIRSLQDDGYVSATKKTLGASKKLVTKTLVSRLMKVSSQLTSLHTEITNMKNKSAVLEGKIKRQDDCAQLDVIQRVDDLASTMQKALNYLQDDEGKDRSVSGLKDGKRVSLKPSITSEMEQQKKDAFRLKHEEQMKTENERLKKELELALSLKQSESSALEQVERYKEVVARVTADNMVFLMKLKQSEQALHIAQEQQRDLAKQLEIGRLKFIEEVSTEIEDTVMASLSKAEACEKELQLLQKDHEKKTRECQEMLQEAQENLHQTISLKERLTELEEERLQILSRLESESREKEDARVEVQALFNDVKALNEQLSKLKAEHMEEVKGIQDKMKEMELKEQEVDQLLVTLDRTSAQLETQQAINVVLMKKKEEMEWLFLEAKAEKENLQKQCRRLVHK